MTSRFSQRAAGVAAATAIVLLVVLIVLLWTNVGQDFFHASPAPGRKDVGGGSPRRDRPGALGGGDFGTTYLEDDLYSTISDLSRPEEIRLAGRQGEEEAREETPVSREYVKPIKISPLGLHEDDLLYGSDRLEEDDPDPEPVQLRHHSGHFRHKTADIWDPHPMYEFTAFRKKFNLVLEHDSKFASPDLQVTHIWHNTSTRKLPRIKSNGCFYKGYVKGDPSSSVAVSLCHGMTGHIRTSTGSYFIEPSEQSSDHAKPIEHVIYEMSAVRGMGKDFRHCGLADDYDQTKSHRKKESEEARAKHDPDMLFDYDTDYLHHVHGGTRSEEPDEHNSGEKHFQRRRSKRSTSQEYFVEMLVVADRSMANYHGGDVENYILALMYIVSGIFKDASIGNPITIALVKLEILYDKDFAQQRYPPHDGVSAAEMLREFCLHQARNNIMNEDSAFHHDTALLLTRENICRNASAQKCETLGLAELGTMCDRKSSCSLVQDNGLSAAFTIAHELGHVLNMPHDDAELKCRPHTRGDSVSHVMSTSLKEGTDPWSWSECSRHFITEFLDSRHSHCLRDRPIKDFITDFPDVLPGETIEGNRQCELLYGEGSHICSYMPVCSALWCNKVDSDGCQTLHMPWGDGTPCGEGAWCQKGLCVEKDRRALKKVDGGWGSWQGFGPCSRTCGGGVKKSYRDCDNPRPQNGGKYCIGRRVRYKSCGTRDCPEGSKGFREAQCSAFDYNSHNIHGVPSTVRWIPKYGMTNDDRCILYCRVFQSNLYYSLKDKVIDGTPCAPESFDICVNGQCKPAGCDHILSSDVRLDQCGKCGGNNDTCRLIRGSFNASAEEQGYRTVVRIPAGSSNLDIRQHGIYGARDDNYLVLKDGVTGGRLLNNENVLTTFRKLIFYDGVTLEYSGCLRAVERINASRPLKRDLLVEVLSAGSLTPPDITYQYTVPKSNEQRYMWRFLDDEWDSCDQVCNGERRRKMVCVTADTNEIVADSYCSAIRKPPPIVEECNTNCVLKWRITGRTECSSNCGLGVRMITKECVQEIAGHRDPYPVHNSSCLHLSDAPPDVEECEGPCNVFNWKYGDWSFCSKSCGSGIQIRDAYCADELGRRVGEEKCDPQEKVTERVCASQSCPTWSYGEWSECSVTCGVGIRTRGHWCRLDNQVIEMNYCNAETMPVHQEKCVMLCPSWTFSDWGPCSATCDVGLRRRSVFCKTSEGNVVNDSLCSDKPKPPTEHMSEPCRNAPCPVKYYPEGNGISRGYNVVHGGRHKSGRTRQESHPDRWVTFPWEQCSVTCGEGFKTRRVKCLSPYGRESNGCPESRRPIARYPCNERECPVDINVTWVEEPWMPCSRTCGNGTQQRLVSCRLPSGKYLHDEACSHLPKPPVQQSCFHRPCQMRRKFRWKVGAWSPCSRSCGRGERIRVVKCARSLPVDNNSVHPYGGYPPESVWVDDRHCDRQNKPREKRKCSKKLCPLTWLKGEWSECSKSCGEGVQNRTVTCHRVNSYDWLDPVPVKNTEKYQDQFCDLDERPSLSRTCKLRDCDAELYWSPQDWMPCTATCGRKGIQKMTYTCHDRSGRPISKSECKAKDIPKPLPKTRPCNRRPCGNMNCQEVQLHTNARTDDEYAMLVGGRNMSIYCKGMSTGSPAEYLTLPHPEDNYSAFFNRRLTKLAHRLSQHSNGTDDCDACSGEESEKESDLTIFYKVRLLVKTLEVVTQDFTFSKQIRGVPVAYGEAGDCCNQLQCIRGGFRINLNGTSLEVSPSQTWAGKHYRTLKIIEKHSPQIITGTCGGGCGSCTPYTRGKLKLYVQPP